MELASLALCIVCAGDTGMPSSRCYHDTETRLIYGVCRLRTLAALVMVPAVSIMSSTRTATLSFTSPIRFITSDTLCEERLLSTIASGASFSYNKRRLTIVTQSMPLQYIFWCFVHQQVLPT